MAAVTALAGATLLAVGAPGEAAGIATRGWDPPVLVSASLASRETSLALNPADEKLMLICGPSGAPSTDNGQSYFHRSTNGGRKWATVNVETAQTDPRKYAFEGGDCDVAFDEGGTMYSADTWLGNLSVGHSTDKGKTWDGTPIAVSAPIVDRPWLVGGPKGTVYLTYQDLQCCSPSAIWFTKSTDYGKTFSPVVPVATAGPAGVFTWQGNFVVSKSGQDLYLVHSRRETPGLTSVDGTGGEIVTVVASHDGGTTWTPHDVATLTDRTASIYPSIGMDAAGYLHVVYSAPRDGDLPVWYSISKDEGATWSRARPLKSGATGVAPWVVGGKAGEAAVVWLGSTDPNALGSDEAPWYFYWARVTRGGTRFATGRTTTRPMYVGAQPVPEFEMVRLDQAGRMHIGMCVFNEDADWWVFYYQRESPRS